MSDRRPAKGHHDSGILRKAKPQHTPDAHLDDLLVFGYACKIFRDNERASEIDHGKHLIPWMTDNSLKIDRYDVRATLSDIRPYEAPPGGYADRMASLTPAEQRAEQLCEEERYLSLYNDDVDEEMYKDEELKRLHKQRSSTYGQVAFDYEPQAESKSSAVNKTVEEEPDTPYQSNPRFYVPPDIELPDSMKLHAVIEKTAKFIATQGPQMEILIKAKQSNNPQFEFLNLNNRLNRYYKHLLNAVKHGFYPAEETNDVEPTQPEESNPVEEEPSAIVVPQIRYKPSADCSYTQLISKIKGVPIPTSNGSESTQLALVEDKLSNDKSFQHIMTYRNKMKMNEQVYAKKQSTSINHLTSSSVTVDAINSRKPVALLSTPISDRPRLPNGSLPMVAPAKVEIKKISSGLMLAQSYNSETEDDDDEDNVDGLNTNLPTEQEVAYDFPLPEPELRNIIDKTAAYVLKNGKEFEEILRIKNDERFAFLKYTDQYYKYYVHKVTGAICSAPLPMKPTNVVMPSTNGNSIGKESPPPKIISAVSFSIKPRDEATFKLAVPQEASSDEEIGNDSNAPAQLLSTPLLPNPYPSLCATDLSTAANIESTSTGLPNRPQSPTRSIDDHLGIAESTIPNMIQDENKSNTNDKIVDQIKEAKRAEERVKDRLAQIARDKLCQVTKDKQLQLERRKKAMAFLSQIKPVDKEPHLDSPAIASEPRLDEAVPEADKSPCRQQSSSISADTLAVVYTAVAVPVQDGLGQMVDNRREGSVISVHSEDSSPERPAQIVENGGVVSDDDDHEARLREHRSKRSRKRSRSPTKCSSSKRHKRKKSKHRHGKKIKSSRSKSRSRSNSLDKLVSRRRQRSRSRSSKRNRPVDEYEERSSSRKKHRHRYRDRD